jgi:eukaryotic-like serine/threonine-protein kinase
MPPVDPASRLPAALADRYRIVRALGQRGMATVYLARDLKHDREVAIKVLKPELAAVLGAERFLFESSYDVSRDGRRHLLILGPAERSTGQLHAITSWTEAVKRRVSR